MDIYDINSYLEVVLEFLHKNVKNGLKWEKIGDVPILPNCGIYIISNCKLKYIITGTDYFAINDKRYKDHVKLLKKATFFLYPNENFHQKINYMTYKDISYDIIKTLNLKNMKNDNFIKTKDVNEILDFLKVV